MRKLSLTLVPLLFLACGREPVGPTAASPPSFSATSEWDRGSLFLSNRLYVACVGDTVRFEGEVPYTYHEVTSASGNFGYRYRFPSVTPVTPQFSATAVTSGKVWWFKNGGPYNESFRAGPGETLRLKWHEVYVADDGSRLYNDGVIHVVVNANGTLVFDHTEILGTRCEK